jgi:hypothetical protein
LDNIRVVRSFPYFPNVYLFSFAPATRQVNDSFSSKIIMEKTGEKRGKFTLNFSLREESPNSL